MTYTETIERGNKKYYYRVKSIREKDKIKKQRKYLGVNLDKSKLKYLEEKADNILNKDLAKLLTKSELKFLNKIKKKYQKLPKETFENRYEAFISKFTYNSNAIEGNTLSLQETSYILFENRVPAGKSLREINEVLNHKEAFDYILNYKGDINKKFICKIQEIIVKNTLREDLKDQIGIYRTKQIYIRGAKFIPPKPEEVKNEMKALLKWYTINKKKINPLILASYFHAAFEGIHPFIDGNGRTGRLLMNFILTKNDYPMINVPNKRKLEYYGCLEKAQINDSLREFIIYLIKILKEQEILI